MTIVNFLWLIHTLLICLYIFEIARYAYVYYYHSDLIRDLSKTAGPVFIQEWDKSSAGIFTLGTSHVLAYGLAIEAVPVFLIVLIIACFYCDNRMTVLGDRIRREHEARFGSDLRVSTYLHSVNWIMVGVFAVIGAIGLNSSAESGDDHALVLSIGGVLGALIGLIFDFFDGSKRKAITANQAETRQQKEKEAPADDDEFDGSIDEDEPFEFDEREWQGEQGKDDRRRNPGDDRDHAGEPDYASALRDAQATANTISDNKAAQRAAFFEKWAQEPGLHPKIRLYRELVAMLLRERAKGFKGRPDDSPVTDAEARRLLAAPGK